MSEFLAYTVIGLFTGAAYAIAASGLVLTYSTTRVFNIGHGAVGMFFSFVYWDFSIRQGVPVWLSLILVLLVLAPVFGFLIQRFVARDLGNAPVSVSLVVTVALLVGLIGITSAIWKPEPRSIPLFFPNSSYHIGSVIINGQQIITILLSGLVAAALYVLLTRTRVGTAMRASVDNPDLLQLYGGRPQIVAALAWGVGTSLAALAGILLAPLVGLDTYQLTLLVISAYAAAMLGKLTSLPLTYVGAMGLGLAQSYAVGYLQNLPFHIGDKLPGLPAVMPTVFLFAILVLLPQAPLRIGQIKGIASPRVPGLIKSAGWGGGLIVAVVLAISGMADSNLLLVGAAAFYAILMLSLVLLTGYGGFVSLAQFAFAGVGAVAYCKFDQPNLFGLLLAVVVAAAVGAVVAIPVLRLTGLYLGLATLAFAQLMDKLVFQSKYAFQYSNLLNAKRLSLFGTTIGSTHGYVVLMTVFFVLTGMALLVLRRGPLGRILVAMRDSPAACGTLGLDQRWFRVGLFAGSAGIAGLAGALYAGLRESVGANDFIFFNSLLLLLVVVVWGVTSITGAAIGGVFLMELNQLQSHQTLGGLMFVLLAVGAILLAKYPNGLSNLGFEFPKWVQSTVYPTLAERYPGMALRSRDPFSPSEDEPITAGTEKEVDSDAFASR